MAAVTICSDFGAPQNKVCHCFHCFLIYLSIDRIEIKDHDLDEKDRIHGVFDVKD